MEGHRSTEGVFRQGKLKMGKRAKKDGGGTKGGGGVGEKPGRKGGGGNQARGREKPKGTTVYM